MGHEAPPQVFDGFMCTSPRVVEEILVAYHKNDRDAEDVAGKSGIENGECLFLHHIEGYIGSRGTLSFGKEGAKQVIGISDKPGGIAKAFTIIPIRTNAV